MVPRLFSSTSLFPLARLGSSLSSGAAAEFCFRRVLPVTRTCLVFCKLRCEERNRELPGA